MNVRKTRNRPTIQLDKLLSRSEAAELLGVSACSLWRLTRKNELSYVVVGERRVMFLPEDIRAYIARQRDVTERRRKKSRRVESLGR